jgi:hypothetical protein
VDNNTSQFSFVFSSFFAVKSFNFLKQCASSCPSLLQYLQWNFDRSNGAFVELNAELAVSSFFVVEFAVSSFFPGIFYDFGRFDLFLSKV